MSSVSDHQIQLARLQGVLATARTYGFCLPLDNLERLDTETLAEWADELVVFIRHVMMEGE